VDESQRANLEELGVKRQAELLRVGWLRGLGKCRPWVAAVFTFFLRYFVSS
jgi:hypothetical protein